MRTILTLCNFIIMMLVLPCSSHALNYFVNSVTGDDNLFCGQTPDTACKTIKKAVDVFHEGEAVIKISQGSYVEENIHLPATASTKNDITLEGGWDSDFTQQSCDPANTVILAGNTTNPAFNVLFRAFTVNSEIAAYTFRCLTIQNDTSEDLTRAIGMATDDQGQIELTLEHVRVTGFPNIVFYLYSNSNGKFSTRFDQLTLDHNILSDTPNPSIIVQASGNSSASLTMTNSRLQHNGSANSGTAPLFLWTYGQGTLVATLKNNIISDNIGGGGSAGILLQSNGPNPYTLSMANNTIVNNICEICEGAGLLLQAYSSSQPRISMYNTILRGNRSSQQNRDLYLFEQAGSDITFSASYNIMGDYQKYGTPDYTSNHELNLEPQLNAAYHLQSGSPAIDAGQCGYFFMFSSYIRVAPYDDIDGDKRPGLLELWGCDIGADEFVYTFPWPAFLPAILSQGSK